MILLRIAEGVSRTVLILSLVTILAAVVLHRQVGIPEPLLLPVLVAGMIGAMASFATMRYVAGKIFSKQIKLGDTSEEAR